MGRVEGCSAGGIRACGDRALGTDEIDALADRHPLGRRHRRRPGACKRTAKVFQERRFESGGTGDPMPIILSSSAAHCFSVRRSREVISSV